MGPPRLAEEAQSWGLDRGKLLFKGEVSSQTLARLPVVAAVDSTGAGDAFCAGLVWSRVHGAAWRQAVEFANACGALAVTAVGAMAALPDRAGAEALVRSSVYWK